MLILFNGRIRTLNPEQPVVTALAIQDGRILAAGSDKDILNLADRTPTRQDLQGQTVWPGLTDAHLHLNHYALSLDRIDCETATKQECLRRVSERANQSQSGSWILGHGWNQNDWAEGFGTAVELEQAAPGYSVYLTAKSLHASWASPAALKAAGITRNTPDPEGGMIQRDSQGNPTGILMESAMEMVENAIPQPALDETVRLIDRAQRNLWKVGLTGVHDFDGRECFSALQILDADHRLRLRVVKGIPLPNLQNTIELGLRSGFGNDFLRIGSVKLFADGALGPQTAAMIQSYAGQPDQYGVLLLDGEQVFEYGQAAVRAGISMAIHAIGDRANHEMLNGYEQLRQLEQHEHLPHLRHRIEHVQVLHPDDISRLANLDVIASMQPIHATSDMYTADRHWGDRSRLAYAFRSLLDLKTHLIFGSDAPVESPNPFWGLHAAVTRQRPNGEPDINGWYPEQRLTLLEALEAYTTGPAYAASWENRVGQLAPGFFADLILLPDDPFTLPTQEIWQVAPAATMVAGRWVWANQDIP